MKKKMFFKMGVALLLSLAVLVGLAGCGAKPSAPTDGGENTTYDENTGNPIEDAAAATNNLPEQDPDETNVDNGHDLTSQVGGPPYVYEVGGVNFECDINIYDYIYEKNGKMFFDAEKMGNDAGFTTGQFQDRWDGIYLLDALDGGSLYIKIGASPNNKERIDNHEVIGLINVCYMPSFPDSMVTDGTVRVIKNYLNDDYYMITGIGSLIDIDAAKALAYIIDVSRRTPSYIGDSLVEPLNLSKDGSFFVLP